MALAHQNVIDRLNALHNQGQLAHAYLFVGPQRVGKYATALQMAALLNQNDEVTFNRILNKSHPDVITIESEDGGAIKIDQIRFLIDRAQLRSFEGGWKVFIVREVDQLTLEASNALLKTLEEPAAKTLIILTTSVVDNVIDTIRSRCHEILLAAHSQEQATEALINDGVSKEEANVLAGIAEGCVGQAQHLHENKFLKAKRDVLTQFVSSADVEPFLKKITKEKQDVKQALHVLYTFVRDAYLYQQGFADQIIHQDQMDLIERFAGKHTWENLQVIEAQVIEATKAYRANFNMKIPLTLVKELM